MALEFGTNWSELSRMSVPVQGPLPSYETFPAFFLEASLFGILLLGRSRVPPRFCLFSTAMVALGTTSPGFWIMVYNIWMQVPVGYASVSAQFVPTGWAAILFSPVVWVRFPHILLASYLTGASCVAAMGMWSTTPRHASCRPLMLVYPAVNYAVIRGKVIATEEHYWWAGLTG
jgi:cytochrome d ubiquinol oxidase subunit I